MDFATAIQLLSSAGIGGVVGSTITWHLQRSHERRQLWAQYALELTRLHIDAQQKEADATGTTVPVLAPTKLFREIFHSFEAFDKTGHWSARASQEGILNLFHVAPGRTPVPIAPVTVTTAEAKSVETVPASNAPNRQMLLEILLHEDEQYREEMGRHEARLLGVGLTYITGLVAATAWLATQLLENTQTPGQPPWQTPLVPPSPVTSYDVICELPEGLFFYVFTGVPILTSIFFLICARAWSSIRERVQLLKQVSTDAALLVDPIQVAPPIRVLRFSRGTPVEGTRARAVLELLLAGLWGILVIALSCVLLIWTQRYTNGTLVRWIYWGLAVLGTALSIGAFGHLLIRDMRRSTIKGASGPRPPENEKRG